MRAALDGQLKSYVTVTAERAIAAARRAESEIMRGNYRGTLHGIPIGIKDLCYTKGVPTMAGTKVLEDFVPEFNATVVAELEAAGAISLGKLALCEGAQAPYHPELQIPVNPCDATRWSGISSSGAGVATAAGLCFGSIGTDTGGSIRYPSAVNGCVGLKPTYGRISRHGVFPLAESMDHVGPMTRTVEDAAIMYEAMAGFDPRDGTSLPDPALPVRSQLSRGIEGLRIGFDQSYATKNVDAEVAAAIERVVVLLQQLGAEIVEVAMPDLGDPFEIGAEEWYRLVINDVFSKPFNFSGVPTFCVPCGISSDGLPISAQFVGSQLAEDKVLRAGHACELASEWHGKHPSI